jgi:comEA protein
MKNFKVATLVIALAVSLSLLPLIAQQTGAKGGEQKININTASLNELQKLPRVGPQVAQRIIDYRKEHGNFKKIEEIMKVRGIGERTFNQLKDLITVGAESTGK